MLLCLLSRPGLNWLALFGRFYRLCHLPSWYPKPCTVVAKDSFWNARINKEIIFCAECRFTSFAVVLLLTASSIKRFEAACFAYQLSVVPMYMCCSAALMYMSCSVASMYVCCSATSMHVCCFAAPLYMFCSAAPMYMCCNLSRYVLWWNLRLIQLVKLLLHCTLLLYIHDYVLTWLRLEIAALFFLSMIMLRFFHLTFFSSLVTFSYFV